MTFVNRSLVKACLIAMAMGTAPVVAFANGNGHGPGVDQDYDRRGVDQDYDRRGVDQDYDRRGVDQHRDRDRRGVDQDYRPGVDQDYRPGVTDDDYRPGVGQERPTIGQERPTIGRDDYKPGVKDGVRPGDGYLGYRPAEPEPDHTGFNVSIGVGLGFLGCKGKSCYDSDRKSALSLDAKLGYMVSENVGLMVNLWNVTRELEDTEKFSAYLSQTLLVVGPQVMFGRVTAHAGIGASREMYSFTLKGKSSDPSLACILSNEWKPAALIGVGVELLQTERIGLGIEVKYGASFGDNKKKKELDFDMDNLSIGAAIKWK